MTNIKSHLFNKEIFLKNCLKSHQITEGVRNRMCDWLIEIQHTFKISDETYFKAIQVIDNYLKNKNIMMSNEDIHLLGSCSIFIASKFCDIESLRTEQIHEDITQGKFTIDNILEKERDIFQLIGSNLVTPTILEFIDYYIANCIKFCENCSDFLIDYIILIRENSIFYAKLTLSESTSIYEFDMKTFAQALIYGSILKLSRDSSNKIDGILNWVKGIVSSPLEIDLIEKCQKKINSSFAKISKNLGSFDKLLLFEAQRQI